MHQALVLLKVAQSKYACVKPSLNDDLRNKIEELIQEASVNDMIPDTIGHNAKQALNLINGHFNLVNKAKAERANKEAKQASSS